MTRDEVIKMFEENGYEVETNRFYLESENCLQKFSFAGDCLSINIYINYLLEIDE